VSARNGFALGKTTKENAKILKSKINGRSGCTQPGSLQIAQSGHQKRDPKKVEYE